LESLADLQADGLLTQTGDGVKITALGRLLIRNIAMRFDAVQPERTKQCFSKTV
jgi:oxygen-independent coproporphyrinogen-3 oxidase